MLCFFLPFRFSTLTFAALKQMPEAEKAEVTPNKFRGTMYHKAFQPA
jgi:hypothetical protein